MTEQLSDLEAVRKRPRMHVGGANGAGIRHLVWELLANSLGEHLAGRCSTISITLTGDAITLRQLVESGLVGIVCVRSNDPAFDSPTKSRLSTPETKYAVKRVVARAFEAFLGERPALLASFVAALPE